MHGMARSARALLKEGFAKVVVEVRNKSSERQALSEKVEQAVRLFEVFLSESQQFKNQWMDLEGVGGPFETGYRKAAGQEIFQYRSTAWRALIERHVDHGKYELWLRICDHVFKEVTDLVGQCSEALDKEMLPGFNLGKRTHDSWDAQLPLEHRHMLRIAWHPPDKDGSELGRAQKDNSLYTFLFAKQTTCFLCVPPKATWRTQRLTPGEALIIPGEKAVEATGGEILPTLYQLETDSNESMWEVSCLIQVPPT